jgi:hypothetical protein
LAIRAVKDWEGIRGVVATTGTDGAYGRQRRFPVPFGDDPIDESRKRFNWDVL